ncbi:histidine phosphatase family protein [Cellulosimicrobium sp. Marseille-Q4280]|uniref:histidine phosphatase family protein n=1 Tax=Cellulosimicrobium sp. Marseille-Q4280 TaxID=2937992 RepID=UPI00203D81EE|nr:histidine phosphatase family protein [Cellulosimicrobium sp. Marseille-Q4280]
MPPEPLPAPSAPPPPVPGQVPPRARTVHLVTHPEATHHVDGIVGGQHDSDLTPAGARAADRLGAVLRDRIPGAAGTGIVASDLQRTRRTADAIGRALDVVPGYDTRLREKSYGVAEGRPQEWLDARFVPPPRVGDRLRHHEGVDGAETRLDLAIRVYTATSTALASHDGDHLVIVTHGFAATFVVAAWIGMPVEAVGHVTFPVPSGSITTLREDAFFGNRGVVSLGEVVHPL